MSLQIILGLFLNVLAALTSSPLHILQTLTSSFLNVVQALAPSHRQGRILLTLALCAIIPSVYILFLLLRVGFAEQQLFGRSYCVRMSLHVPEYLEPPIKDSCGYPTYTFVRDGKPRHVYKQLINGFQHAYGSALASYELGEPTADLLFRMVEYSEAYLHRNTRTYADYLDTKKDLFNNVIGRDIGTAARKRGLAGPDANQYIVNAVLEAMDRGQVINHFMAPQVRALPSLEYFGCPSLPSASPTLQAATATAPANL